jgi:hypothetical protein
LRQKAHAGSRSSSDSAKIQPLASAYVGSASKAIVPSFTAKAEAPIRPTRTAKDPWLNRWKPPSLYNHLRKPWPRSIWRSPHTYGLFTMKPITAVTGSNRMFVSTGCVLQQATRKKKSPFPTAVMGSETTNVLSRRRRCLRKRLRSATVCFCSGITSVEFTWKI